MPNLNNSELILYQTEDGLAKVSLRLRGRDVYLSAAGMANLFDTSTDNIVLHLKNIYKDGELNRGATSEESSEVRLEGARQVTRLVTLYNLEAILAVGYRIRSPRGIQFRRWASTALQEFLIKGFVMDDQRLKDSDAVDYFDELLERIRDIRASEKRFYHKIRDIFACSVDYDKSSKR